MLTKIPHVLFGGDYNPEQWPEDVWREDVRLMREAGVNIVSLGIFAWSRIEPEPGRYELDWLDRVVDLLWSNEIHVALATATASPPPWLARLHPETLPVDANGVVLVPGSRQHYCPSSDVYRRAAAALVEVLARRYGDHPALALWHVNNELGCHVTACYCDVSAAAFREWLASRYRSVAALNDAWGTSVWGNRYRAWDEILPPRASPSYPNPAHVLDYRRFSSDELLACFRAERSILEQLTPGVPATTNLMGFFQPFDYWRLAATQDLVANDAYPDPSDPDAASANAMACDLMRSLGGGRPWLLLEQAPNAINWRTGSTKPPGLMRLWSHQALARGADGICFFQWRASRSGAERFHSGMLQHDGTESRTWGEVVELRSELALLDEVLDSRVAPVEAAIVLDWESWWAIESPAGPAPDLRLVEEIAAMYLPLFARNVAVDFVRPDGDLSGYRLVLVPSLYLVTDAAAATLEAFVESGGTLAMSFCSGLVDEHERVRLGGYPAPFRRLLGLRVAEFSVAAAHERYRVALDGATYEADLWRDAIELEGAIACASYADGDWLGGRPAITEHRVGRGTTFYLGTRLERAGMRAFLDRVVQASLLAPAAEAPAGVEVVRRRLGDRSFVFVLNHAVHPVEVGLDGSYRDVLGGGERTGRLVLDPYGVAVLEPVPAAVAA